MSTYEAVDIYLKDKTGLANPIPDVVTKVMNQAGTLIFSMATSDQDGRVSLLLESGITYQLRFFKRQVIFSNPKYITVLEAPVAPDSNVFDVQGEPFVPPISTDARLCVASGTFRRPDGSPHPFLDIQFIPKFDPILLEGSGILAERVSLRTDKNGYAQVSLIRFAKYDATVQGFEDTMRRIEVPDLASTNLPDLLFPVVEEISLDPPGPYVLAHDEELEITPTVVTSDGRVLEGTATDDVAWRSTDLNILALSIGQTTLKIRGVDAGSAQILCERNDTTVIRIPNTPIIGAPVDATVT